MCGCVCVCVMFMSSLMGECGSRAPHLLKPKQCPSNKDVRCRPSLTLEHTIISFSFYDSRPPSVSFFSPYRSDPLTVLFPLPVCSFFLSVPLAFLFPLSFCSPSLSDPPVCLIPCLFDPSVCLSVPPLPTNHLTTYSTSIHSHQKDRVHVCVC